METNTKHNIEISNNSATSKVAQNNNKKNLLTATQLGLKYGFSPIQTNAILAEIGWITKAHKGWMLTESGKEIGGVQDIAKNTGNQYVRWPQNITKNITLISLIEELDDSTSKDNNSHYQGIPAYEIEFRNKFPPSYRAIDGHYVRSRGELLIDNWLYMFGVVHAYERKLHVEELLYCDFYLPAGKVYIEYWGLDSQLDYIDRKQRKLETYRKYNFSVIELTDEEIKNLDDILPHSLRHYGINTE